MKSRVLIVFLLAVFLALPVLSHGDGKGKKSTAKDQTKSCCMDNTKASASAAHCDETKNVATVKDAKQCPYSKTASTKADCCKDKTMKGVKAENKTTKSADKSKDIVKLAKDDKK